jgi:hypothetical protein
VTQVEIPLTPLVDNSRGWTEHPVSHASRDRSVYLRFEPTSIGDNRGPYRLTALGAEIQRHLQVGGGGQPEGILTTKLNVLESAITQVHEAWRDCVVRHSEPTLDGESWHPFGAPDLSRDQRADARLREVVRPLATAGNNLYRLLFCGGDNAVRAIGGVLEKILRDPGHLISVQSDSLFVPWRLLYTPPPGYENFQYDPDSPVSWEGFWGYSHLVEHNFNYSLEWKPCILVSDARIVAGVNVDTDLDEQFPEAPSIKPVLDMFESDIGVGIGNVITRESKIAFGSAIKAPDYGDNIVYFGCHGTGVSAAADAAESEIRLTDKVPIRSTDLTIWLAGGPLPTAPLIFINACEAGQMSSIYTSIGQTLMGLGGANCLIGAQIDVPPAFAAEYARRFFPEIITTGDGEPILVGDAFHRQTQTWLTQRKNPLGLIMSLYRGLDSHFCRATDLWG